VRLDAGGTLYGSFAALCSSCRTPSSGAEHLSDRLCGRMTTLIGVVLFCTGRFGYPSSASTAVPTRNQGDPNAPPPPFTLVELLVVVTIIAVLAGLILAGGGLQPRARTADACANNRDNLAKAVASFELARRQIPGYANNARRARATRGELAWDAPAARGSEDLWVLWRDAHDPDDHHGDEWLHAPHVELFPLPERPARRADRHQLRGQLRALRRRRPADPSAGHRLGSKSSTGSLRQWPLPSLHAQNTRPRNKMPSR
jgi:prepilin-type N-terminal cleavage/methylation domain-containing protein